MRLPQPRVAIQILSRIDAAVQHGDAYAGAVEIMLKCDVGIYARVREIQHSADNMIGRNLDNFWIRRKSLKGARRHRVRTAVHGRQLTIQNSAGARHSRACCSEPGRIAHVYPE